MTPYSQNKQQQQQRKRRGRSRGKSSVLPLAVALVAFSSSAKSVHGLFPKNNMLVTMFSGPPADIAAPSPTQEAMALLGQEMVADYIQSDPWVAAVENTVVPLVDGFLHRTLDPLTGVVAQITNNENATAEYIVQADEAVVDAIETTLLHPEEAPLVLGDLNEILYGPVVEVAEEGVAEVRENVVTTVDKNLRAMAAPFQPFAHLMGKDNDVEAWIEAVDASLGNVIELQPASEEAQALIQLRDTLMQPYYQSKLTTDSQIEQDISSMDPTQVQAMNGPPQAPPVQETFLQRYYRRFWELRNGLSGQGQSSIDDVLANGYPSSSSSAPPLPLETATVFQQSDVTKEHFSSDENRGAKVQSLKAIRGQLQDVLGESVSQQLVEMNPRFLLKHPHWVARTAAQLMEENPAITREEVSAALEDMLRMKRMKKQARILTMKGCTSQVVEQKLKEYWVENKAFQMKDVQC
jgi:hypothetical protein